MQGAGSSAFPWHAVRAVLVSGRDADDPAGQIGARGDAGLGGLRVPGFRPVWPEAGTPGDGGLAPDRRAFAPQRETA